MPTAIPTGPVAVKPAPGIAQRLQSRPHFLDFPFAYGLGSQGYNSGQGAVSTTLTAQANPGDQTLTVASITGVVAGMMLNLVPAAIQWPITYQTFVVTSAAGSTITLTGAKVGSVFPVDTVVEATWANDTHIADWNTLTEFILDARIRSTVGGSNLIAPTVGRFVGWSNGTSAAPDGWAMIGGAAPVRTQYATGSTTCNARPTQAATNQFGVQIGAVSGQDAGMDINSPVAVAAGQRLNLAALCRMNVTGVNAWGQLEVRDATHARTVTDGATSSTGANTTLTSATAAFVATDEGSRIWGAGIPAFTTIVAVVNATTVLLSNAATATATGVTVTIGGPVLGTVIFGDPQATNSPLATVQVDAYEVLTRCVVPFTVPPGCTQIAFGVRNASAGAILVSDFQLLAARQDQGQNMRVVQDPGPYGIAMLGDSWGRGIIDSGGFAAACRARFGRSINLIDSCHTGDTFATVLSRLPGLLGASPQRTVTDGVLNGTTTVTSATANFTSADKGALVMGNGIPSGLTIISVTNSTTVDLSRAVTATASGVTLQIGSGPAPSYVVYASTLMNEGTSFTLATEQQQVQSFIDQCRDAGAIPVFLGAGIRNSSLQLYMQLNEAVRAQVNSAIGTCPLTDANVAVLSG